METDSYKVDSYSIEDRIEVLPLVTDEMLRDVGSAIECAQERFLRQCADVMHIPPVMLRTNHFSNMDSLYMTMTAESYPKVVIGP